MVRSTRDLRSVPSGDPETPETASERRALAEGVPLTEIVPRTLAKAPEVVLLSQPRSVAAEKFRRLKTKLLNEYRDDAHVVVVTSPAPDEGKSVVALNLALALSEESPDTLLIDADLRRPTVQRWLTPAPALGLSEVLHGAVPVAHALIHVRQPVVTILPAGKAVPEPGALFSADAFKALIESLRTRYRRIVIDTPPILPFTDADVIGASADGVLLVTRARQTLRSAYTQAVSLVTSTRILGVVLNDVVPGLADHSHYHDGYYDEYYKRSREDT